MKAVRIAIVPVLLALGLFVSQGFQSANANQQIAMNPVSVPGIDWNSPASLRNAYRIHMRKRNIHAAHLNTLWQSERDLSNSRDVAGRSGDMATVQQVDQRLYAVRMQIDQRRAALTYENRILTMIDERLAGR